MPETIPPPDFACVSLDEIARLLAERRLPPVEQWRPERSGDSGMQIARDGSWHHEGAPIPRPAMVRLFASLLRREADGGFVLVTPAEKLAIAVEDTPFIAVELKSEGEGQARRLAFRLNTDELVVADAAHPVRFGNPRPSLTVRDGLEARIARPVYYELAEIALAEEGDPPGLWSDGAFFALEDAA